MYLYFLFIFLFLVGCACLVAARVQVVSTNDVNDHASFIANERWADVLLLEGKQVIVIDAGQVRRFKSRIDIIEALEGCIGRGRSGQDCLTDKVTPPTTLGAVSSHKG